MSKTRKITRTGRRKFLSSAISAACVLCCANRNILAAKLEDSTNVTPGAGHRFLKDSHMTYEEVLKYAYSYWFIPAMKVLAEDIGEEELNGMLGRVASEAARRMVVNRRPEPPDNTLSAFAGQFEKPNHILENSANIEIVENDGRVLELKVTECLWAKVFRDANAATIGYSYICYPDYAVAQAFNTNIVLHRTMTLMEGCSHCNHRYEVKT